MGKTKLWATIVVATLLGITMIGIKHIDSLNDGIELKKIELKDNSVKLRLLDEKYDLLNKELNKKDADKAKVEEQLKQLQIERDKLQADLQAKIKAKEQDIAAKAQKAATGTQVAYAANCNSPKACIYMKESGNNPNAVNSIGCRGLGQACPGTKLPCGADYACQDAYFTNYAMQRYGSWEAAWAFWQNNHWW